MYQVVLPENFCSSICTRLNYCEFWVINDCTWSKFESYVGQALCSVRVRLWPGACGRRWRCVVRDQLKRAKFSPLGRYEARIARVTITARPAIFMPAVTKLPDIIPSHWVRKAQIKPILYWTIFLESGGEICSLLDKKPRRLRYEIRKELQVIKSCFRINTPPRYLCVFDCD